MTTGNYCEGNDEGLHIDLGETSVARMKNRVLVLHYARIDWDFIITNKIVRVGKRRGRQLRAWKGWMSREVDHVGSAATRTPHRIVNCMILIYTINCDKAVSQWRDQWKGVRSKKSSWVVWRRPRYIGRDRRINNHDGSLIKGCAKVWEKVKVGITNLW